MIENLPDKREDDQVSAAEWNLLKNELRRLGKLTVAAPLQMSDGSGGLGLSLNLQPEYFRVITKNGAGADGDDANPPAYVYDVYDLNGTNLIEAAVEMIGPRPNGLTTKAPDGSYATATFDENGDLKLWTVLEKPTDEICT